MTTSIFHCEQCGGLLASRDEYRAGRCAACQFDRDWRAMQDERARRMVADAIRQSPKSRAGSEQTTVTEPGRKGS